MRDFTRLIDHMWDGDLWTIKHLSVLETSLKGSYCPKCLEVFSRRDLATPAAWRRAGLIGHSAGTIQHDCNGKFKEVTG